MWCPYLKKHINKLWDSHGKSGSDGPACAGFTIMPAFAVPDVYLDVTPGPLAPGAQPTWTAYGSNLSRRTGDPSVDAASTLTQPRFDLIVSSGHTVDPASLQCVSIATGSPIGCHIASSSPGGSGTTHVVVDLDDDLPPATGGRQVRMTFRTTVDPLTDQSQVRVDAYLSSDNNPVLTNPRPATALGALVPDTNDVNGNGYADGATTEWLATARAQDSVVVSATLASVKTAQGSLDAAPVAGGTGVARTVDGGPVTYGLAVRNTSPSASATGLVLYDVLPHVGDTGVVATQAGTDRGSAFRVSMTGAPVVTGPTGAVVGDAVVAYSMSEVPCRPEVGVTTGCTDDWTTAVPADLSDVRAVRISLPSTVLAKGERVDVSLPAAIPTGVPAGDTAYNSFGYAADLGAAHVAAEPAKVGVTVAAHGVQVLKYDSVSGTPLDGAVFELRRGPADSDPVVARLTTDANGSALTTVYDAGEYCLREVTPPTGYRLSFTPQCSTLALDGTTWTVYAADDPLRFAIGDRVWSDLDRDGVQDTGEPGVGGVTVRVYDASGTQVAQTTTGPDGTYRVDNLLAGTYQVRFSGLPAGDSFTAAGAGGQPALDSDVDARGRTAYFSLGTGQPGVRAATSTDGVSADWFDDQVDAGLVSPHEPSTTPGGGSGHGSGSGSGSGGGSGITVDGEHAGTTGSLAYTGATVRLSDLLLTAAGMIAAGALLLRPRRRSSAAA